MDRGFAPIPLDRRSKATTRHGWQKFRASDATINQDFPPDGNVGVLNGEPSNGLIDVDLDSVEARCAAAVLLPTTDLVGGRESAPDSHRWYIADDPPAKASEAHDDPTTPGGARVRLVESPFHGQPDRCGAKHVLRRTRQRAPEARAMRLAPVRAAYPHHHIRTPDGRQDGRGGGAAGPLLAQGCAA